MVQSTESREGVDCALSPASDRYWSTGWRILRQSEVGPIFMVVAHILGQQPLEVLLIQDVCLAKTSYTRKMNDLAKAR